MGPGEPPERLHAARIADTLTQSIAAVRDREIGQGISVVGPHRDELIFTLGGDDAGTYASRGQARTVALALKLAEAEFVARDTGRSPVLALDDVLSELDVVRRRLVLEAVREYGQVLLTTTDLDRVDDEFLSDADRWQVSGGEVSHLEE
jgi:DNA replication and repair protein RecF